MISPEVERAYHEAARVPLRLAEDFLRPDRQLLAFHYAEDFAAETERIVCWPLLGRIFFNGAALVLREGLLRVKRPSFELRREAGWLGVAAIEAFFGWTEHVLIHIAILQGKITTGEDVARLAASDWSDKVKTALDLTDATTKRLFDELLTIRRQIRNYMAHGAFGKEGEAFQFHSAAGAVPVMLTDRNGADRFSFDGPPSFDEAAAIETVESFVKHLWSGSLAPAKIFIQDAEFPVVLTFAKDGTYTQAMQSEEDMEQFVEYWGREIDNAANMDW